MSLALEPDAEAGIMGTGDTAVAVDLVELAKIFVALVPGSVTGIPTKASLIEHGLSGIRQVGVPSLHLELALVSLTLDPLTKGLCME